MRNFVPGFSEELLDIGCQGKPFLPEGVPFNLSHGGNYIVLAVCRESDGIGIDTEPIPEMDHYRDILPYAMTGNERESVGSDAHKAVCIWTRKESLFKCIGEGISDFRELPEVLEDVVPFWGRSCRLHRLLYNSREELPRKYSLLCGRVCGCDPRSISSFACIRADRCLDGADRCGDHGFCCGRIIYQKRLQKFRRETDRYLPYREKRERAVV